MICEKKFILEYIDIGFQFGIGCVLLVFLIINVLDTRKRRKLQNERR